MGRFYKKFIFIDSADANLRLEGRPDGELSWGQKLGRLLTLQAMIAGGILGAVFFSAFLALLLIPLAIWGARSWWLFRKLKAAQADAAEQIIDGEYSVIERQQPGERR